MKQILVSVLAAGCITRFRNGEQFTKTPKEVLVDDSELAVLQADSYLSVDVLSHDAQITGNGADNENAITNNVVVTKDTHVVPDTPAETIIITPDMASDDGTIVADTAEAAAGVGTGTVAHDAVETDDSTIADVSIKPVDHLETITITPDMASDDGTIVADTEKAAADVGTGTVAQDNVIAIETESTDVSENPGDHLNIVTESLRLLNLDVTADKPTVKALKGLGLDVSAKERDDAWAVLVAESNA